MKCLDKKTFNNIIDSIPVGKFYERGYKCRLIITGSFFLHINGLIDEFNDVDILVVDAPKSFWSELFSNDYKWDIRDYGDYKSVKIVFENITYNLIEDNSYTEFGNGYADLNEEIEFDTISHALKAKADLKREKDKPHFELIKQRFNQLIEQ